MNFSVKHIVIALVTVWVGMAIANRVAFIKNITG